MTVLERLARKLEGRDSILVLPEGDDERILRAARILLDRDLAKIVLIGPQAAIETAASAADVSCADFTVIDPATSEHIDSFARQYLELRPKTSFNLARRIVSRPLFFGGSMVKAGQADALLAGAANTTAKVIEASLMTIGLANRIKTPSSCFLMLLGEQTLIYADCALNVVPDCDTLADIAIASAESAQLLLDEEPRLAFLSFSTKGSGKHGLARKIHDASQIAAERAPDISIDGELQADAALDERAAKLKLDDPGPVAGRANVLVFPDLNAANIAYKLTQHLAGATALGPFLQGFARPVSDLSRGATVDDIVATAIVTLARASVD